MSNSPALTFLPACDTIPAWRYSRQPTRLQRLLLTVLLLLVTACLGDDATRAHIERDIQDARVYGVEGTPTYFVNGRLIRGAVSFEEFDNIVSQER